MFPGWPHVRRAVAVVALGALAFAAAPARPAAADDLCAEPGSGRLVRCHHTVRRGEWLWSIARQNLRDDFGMPNPRDADVHTRAREVQALNPEAVDDHPDRLREGAVLRLYPWVDGAAEPPPVGGPLDLTFGRGGVASATVPGTYTDAAALAVDAEGRFVTAGLQSRSFGVFRFTADGIADPSFGTGGRVSTPLGTYARAGAVAVQADGRIVVAGLAALDPGAVRADVVVVRYLPDGSSDPTFGGGDGVVTTAFAGYASAEAVAVQADGRIVVAGSADPDELSLRADVTVLRYLADGSLDPSFGDGGRVTTDVAGGTDVGNALRLQPDGRIVVAGTADVGGDVAESDLLAVRYLADGRLDATFGGGDGIVTTDVGSPFDSANAVALGRNGTVLLAGGWVRDRITPEVVVARYLDDGTLDDTFGADGIVRTEAGEGSEAEGVAVDRAGRPLVVGSAGGIALVLRYTPDGTLDTTFGDSGMAHTSFGGDRSRAVEVLLDESGRIVVGGCTCDGSNTAHRGGFEIPSSAVAARYRA